MIPVYPIDVVKTNIQVSDGKEGTDASFLGTAADPGRAAIRDLLGRDRPEARAGVNHAVTFYVFDLVVGIMAAV